MITGDNPKCYANDLRIFGIQRGSGESIWELKRDMGIVSPDLHRNYRAPGTTRQVVLSGLFDSIGLYRRPTGIQERRAMQWLEWIGLAGRAGQPFRRLSFAEQRLVLIARALIKLPRLLILDEPTQGLDNHNRAGLLDFLEQIAANRISTVLYVSHRQDEYRPFFRRHIRLGAAGPPAPMS
jgi:molybdate transport system ATP-binding protein